MYIYILVGLIVIIIYKTYLKKETHEFWDKQPVSRGDIHNSNGIIIKSKDLVLDYNNSNSNYNWNYINNIFELRDFLLTHYSKYELYDIYYLNWELNSPHQHITKLKNMQRFESNITLRDNNKLIGTIVGKPIIININNNIVEGFYVNFLCINKDYRKLKLAPMIISKLLELWKKYKLDIHIFKIDHQPLPFNNIGIFNYYYIELNKLTDINESNSNIIELTDDKIVETYNYFYDQIRKYKLYQIMTINEFKYYFISNNFIKSYIIYDKDKDKDRINGFISFIQMKYKHPTIKNKIVNCIELSYFLYDDYKLIYYFINLFKQWKIDYLILLDIMNFKNIIDKFPNEAITKSHKTYYHLYNYTTNISHQQIGLNFI